MRERFCDSIDTLYVTRLRTGGTVATYNTRTRETTLFWRTAYKYTNTRGEEGMRDEGEEKEKNTVVSSVFFFLSSNKANRQRLRLQQQKKHYRDTTAMSPYVPGVCGSARYALRRYRMIIIRMYTQYIHIYVYRYNV